MEAILEIGILLVESRDVRCWQILLQKSPKRKDPLAPS
jgi:hypothetical protein